MSDNRRPCEVYDIGITAFRQLFPDKETNVGDYWVASTFGRLGFVCSDVTLFWNNGCSSDLVEQMRWMYANDLYYLKEGSTRYAQDYEVWHVVEDNPSCLEGEDYPYWVALYEQECEEDGCYWVPVEYVWFRREEHALMFAERVCGYPFMRTAVGLYDSPSRTLRRYECLTVLSGRKLVKRGW